MCYSKPGPKAREGPTATTRFRTIQVCPKDLASVLREAERAVNRPMAARGGWRTPMFGMRRREFITLLGGVALSKGIEKTMRRVTPLLFVALLGGNDPGGAPGNLEAP